MTVWSYSQLEEIWIQGGGSRGMAPLMAAIAMVESSGNDHAYNPSGATGLWQIEWPLHKGLVPGATSQQAYYNPLINAQAAVKLSQNNPSTSPGSPVYSNWLEWEPAGAYKRFLQSHVAPSGPVAKGGSSGTKGGGTPAAGSQGSQGSQGSTTTPQAAAQLTSAVSGNLFSQAGNVVSDAGTLLGDAATVLNWFFEFFKPGQGWRIAFGAAAAGAGVAGARQWHSAGSSPGAGGNLPLAVGLFGVAGLGAFMALRPWPQQDGKPVTPAAYAESVVSGQPMAAGPVPASDKDAIETGLAGLLAAWALSKIASYFGGIGNFLNGGGSPGSLPGGEGEGGGEAPPVEEPPPVEEIPPVEVP